MKRVIRASEYEDQFAYPLAAELKSICEEAGYTLYVCERMSRRLWLSILCPREGRWPEIYFNNGRFTIQTTSYGALSPDDFEEFLYHQDTALKLVRNMIEAIDRIGVSPDTVMEYQFE